MQNSSELTSKRTISVSALLASIFSAVSGLLAGWVAYQNSQINPTVSRIETQVQQMNDQLQQVGGGVNQIGLADQSTKLELYRRLAERGDRKQVQQVFREVFPEDKIWTQDPDTLVKQSAR